MNFQLRFQFLLILSVTSHLAFADHQTTRTADSSRGTGGGRYEVANCLAALNEDQIKILEGMKPDQDPSQVFLDQVRAIAYGYKPDEAAEKQVWQLLRDLEIQGVPSSVREALSAVALGEFTMGRKIRNAQRPLSTSSGPIEKPAIAALLKAGATKKGNGLLSIAGLKLPLNEELTAALKDAFPGSESEIDSFKDGNNTVPVHLGDETVMPKAYTGGSRILSKEAYQANISFLLTHFKSEMRDYMEFSNDANSGWKQFTQGWSNSWGGGDNEVSESRKLGEKFYNAALKRVDELENIFGFPHDQAIKLRNSIKKSVEEDSKNLNAGLSQMEWAAGTVALAPALWYVKKFADAFKGARDGIGLGLAIGAADMMFNAINDTNAGRGDLLCNIGKQLMEKGPTVLIGSVVLGMAGGPTLQLLSKVPQIARAAGAGDKLVKALSATGKAALPTLGGAMAAKSLASANDKNQEALAAEQAGNGESANELRRQRNVSAFNAARDFTTGFVLPYLGRKLANAGKPKASDAGDEVPPANSSGATPPNRKFPQIKEVPPANDEERLARLAQIEESEGIKFTPDERTGIDRAHGLGRRDSDGNYSRKDIKEKLDVLLETLAGRGKEAAKKLADLLMRRGVAGDPVPRRVPNPYRRADDNGSTSGGQASNPPTNARPTQPPPPQATAKPNPRPTGFQARMAAQANMLPPEAKPPTPGNFSKPNSGRMPAIRPPARPISQLPPPSAPPIRQVPNTANRVIREFVDPIVKSRPLTTAERFAISADAAASVVPTETIKTNYIARLQEAMSELASVPLRDLRELMNRIKSGAATQEETARFLWFYKSHEAREPSISTWRDLFIKEFPKTGPEFDRQLAKWSAGKTF